MMSSLVALYVVTLKIRSRSFVPPETGAKHRYDCCLYQDRAMAQSRGAFPYSSNLFRWDKPWLPWMPAEMDWSNNLKRGKPWHLQADLVTVALADHWLHLRLPTSIKCQRTTNNTNICGVSLDNQNTTKIISGNQVLLCIYLKYYIPNYPWYDNIEITQKLGFNVNTLIHSRSLEFYRSLLRSKKIHEVALGYFCFFEYQNKT